MNFSTQLHSLMSLFQQSGLGDITSQQLTTTVTSFSSIALAIPTYVSPWYVNIFIVWQSELYQAIRTFPKSEYLVLDDCPSIRPSTSNNSQA
jgi:hypothetical protein